ncbi:MAG: diacylglycerol kinase family protein [bacterium]
MSKLSNNRQFGTAQCLAILSHTQLMQLERYRELLPQVLPGVQIICPDSLDDMRRIVTNSHSTHELVLVIGGDGTLNRVLQHVDLERQVLAILPSGTGNDFASFIGFPASLEKRVVHLQDLEARETDYGLIGEIRYMNSAGFGIDTETLQERERRRGIIRSNYNLLFLLALAKMRTSQQRITAGEFSESGHFYWILGMNSALIGGGTKIAPDARIDDGLIDMLLIRETSKFDMIRLMPAAIKGQHIGSGMVEYRQVPEFSVASEDPVAVLAADGECYDWGKREVSLRCVPAGLRMLR